MASIAPVVAIVNTNDDIVEMLRTGLEVAGLIAVSIHIDDIRRGRTNLDSLVTEHDPRVIVYDIAPPYERNWRYLTLLRNSRLMKGRQFIVTSTNTARARELGGGSENVYEIVGKPYDIDQLVDVIREAVRARPVRDQAPRDAKAAAADTD